MANQRDQDNKKYIKFEKFRPNWTEFWEKEFMATFKENPTFDLYIAEQALRNYYNYYKPNSDRLLDKITTVSSLANAKEENLKRIYLRAGRILSDYRLIGGYIVSLSEAEQKFLYFRYGRNENYCWISERLYVSISSLCVWNSKFLKELSHILSYQLTLKDVFSCLRVINVVHSLDYRINMLLSNKAMVDQVFLDYLAIKRKNYRTLMYKQNEILQSPTISLHNEIISTKLLHNNESTKILCEMLHQTRNTIGWHLRKYENEVKKYLI